MRLIYIYGPPAAGKLTVARALSALTGYRIFHNHLSIDCVRPLFDFGTEPFWRQVFLIRQNMLEEAARQNVDLVYTSAFAYPKDIPLAHQRFKAVEALGGRIRPVHITCSVDALLQRVTSEDRVAANKLATHELMDQYLRDFDFFTPIPDWESLKLDNTEKSPQEVARLIAEHYGLPLAGTDLNGVSNVLPNR